MLCPFSFNITIFIGAANCNGCTNYVRLVYGGTVSDNCVNYNQHNDDRNYDNINTIDDHNIIGETAEL